VTLTCPVCGAANVPAPVLEVPSMSPPHAVLALLRCAGCNSLHYDPPGITDFKDLGQDGDEFWRFYVEVGGGVWETIWPTLAERTQGRRTLLDVGCGFGFTIDFWRRMIGGEAIGVELADYGQVGARLLDVPIYDEPLQTCAALEGRRFDVVYASEVIEHVSDPAAFAALLTRHVADDGVLVLTTPSAEYVEPAQHSASLLAALSPGFHGFLLAKQALADIARNCGFTHVDVRSFGERQVLWASRQPLRVEPNDPVILTSYLDYLAQRIPTLEPSSPVWQGLSYRRLKDLVNAGRLPEARLVGLALIAALKVQYGAEITDPDATLERLKTCVTLTEYGRVAPYFLPGLYYFLGALAQHHDRDAALALRYYRGAVDCTLEAIRAGSFVFLEAISLLWPARARQAELWLARRDLAAGVAMFVRIANEGTECEARNAFALASRDLLEATIPRLCDQIWAAGYRSDAQTLFDAYCRYVERRYGAAAQTLPGIEAALAGRSDGLPLDPLFALYFSGRQGLPSDAAISDLTVLSRIADAYSGHPIYGQRLRELADRARRLLPATIGAIPAGPATSWSFETTYNLQPPER
jgi:SAM-dependent methyltransferase